MFVLREKEWSNYKENTYSNELSEDKLLKLVPEFQILLK